MPDTIYFGGRERPAGSAPQPEGIEGLLGKLSWKYVTPDPTFGDRNEDVRDDIAHWAGRVWFHDNQMPSAAELRSFDIMSLEPAYRQYIAAHGKSLFDRGMSVEEIWASQQLYSAKPMVLILADTYASQPHERVARKFITTSQSMVWVLAAMCMRLGVTAPGINVLVTDGRNGHTISLTGLNGLAFTHPRGDTIQAGWFSFHDPWPARSLLAPEHGYGVRVLEDITRPPYWLISPKDLNKIVAGFLVSVDILPVLKEHFAILGLAMATHKRSGRPLWIEDEQQPGQPFALMLADTGGLTPTIVQSMHGLAKVLLYYSDLDAAIELYEDAYQLDPTGTSRHAARWLAASGHRQLAEQWLSRTHGSIN